MFHNTVQVPRRRQETSVGDRGAVVQIVSWTLLVVVISTFVAYWAKRLSLKTTRSILGLHDLFVALAVLFSIGQTIAVSIQATHGLGQHLGDLADSQLMIYQKAEYAASILYIASLGCARISVCLIIRKILPGIVARYTTHVFLGFTGVWTLSGILASAFPCALPNPWHFTTFSSCYNTVAFTNYIGITNIVMEVLLVMIPLFIWNIRLSACSTVSVSLVFLARLSIVISISVQLHFFNNSNLDDFPYISRKITISEQIAQNLSAISACLPCLHPFILSVLAGNSKPQRINMNHGTPARIRQCLHRHIIELHPTVSHSSRSSTSPLTEKAEEPYCRPLATWGLDCVSTHALSQSKLRFPANVAKPTYSSSPPENFFNRRVEVPRSRPGTSSSNMSRIEVPKCLGEVGVLPVIDWESGSFSPGISVRSSRARESTGEYVFNRSTVISVPEEHPMLDDGVKEFAPPLPSPSRISHPPRAF